MKLSNPSSAYWHLNKLKEHDIIIQLDNSSYKIHEDYENISKINIPVPMQYYIVGNKIMPDVIAILVFLVINFILMIVFSVRFITLTAFIGIFTTLVSIGYMLRFYKEYHNKLDIDNQY